MIVQATIKSEILSLITEMKTITNSAQADEIFATKLSLIIVNALKAADIPILPVQVVPVTGTGATVNLGKLI